MTYLIFNGQLRVESDPQVIANLIRKGAVEIDGPPSPDAQWVGGQWIIPAPRTYSAGEWLELVGFGANQQPTLIYLKLQLQAAGKKSDKLNATEQYLNNILAAFAQDPTPRSDWQTPPFEFNTVVADALGALTR